jgi:prepilin-type N-terminal cleavage/methylation domain-containing protein
VKREKGFTLIELCIVLGIIAILAATTVMYGKTWVSQYRLSNFRRAAEGGVRMARMQAITQGRDCALVVSTQAVNSGTQLLTAADFKGDYVVLGPYLLTTTDNYTKYFAYDGDDNTNTETRVYYLLYNSNLYNVSDVTTGALSSLDSGNIKFNSRGFPYVYVGSSPASPRPYQARSFRLQSKLLKHHNGFTFGITATGKIE